MRIGIVITDPEDWTAKALLASFKSKSVDAVFLSFADLAASISEEINIRCQGLDLFSLDALVVRDLGRSGSIDASFRLEALHALKERGIPVINPPDSITRAANKFATSRALIRNGVPTPRTAVSTSIKEAQKVLHDFEKAVSKPLFGYKGLDIILLEDGVEADLKRLESIFASQGMVYLQEFIASPSPRDIRAFVVGNKVLGAIYRVAPPGEWISNLARGGRANPCPLNAEMERLATLASRAVGTLYCGVDMLETREGLKVIEVNGTPSGKGIFEALGVNAAEAIACHVINLAALNPG